MSALKAAQQCLAIEAVTLSHSIVRVRDDFDPQNWQSEHSLSQSFHLLERVDLQRLNSSESLAVVGYRFLYALGFRIVEKGADTERNDYKPQLEVIGGFYARYRCSRELSQEEFEAFSKENVAWHVWPYWREYLQSMAARAGLREMIEVPMYSLCSEQE